MCHLFLVWYRFWRVCGLLVSIVKSSETLDRSGAQIVGILIVRFGWTWCLAGSFFTWLARRAVANVLMFASFPSHYHLAMDMECENGNTSFTFTPYASLYHLPQMMALYGNPKVSQGQMAKGFFDRKNMDLEAWVTPWLNEKTSWFHFLGAPKNRLRHLRFNIQVTGWQPQHLRFLPMTAEIWHYPFSRFIIALETTIPLQ